jgi:hypothetical protein
MAIYQLVLHESSLLAVRISAMVYILDDELCYQISFSLQYTFMSYKSMIMKVLIKVEAACQAYQYQRIGNNFEKMSRNVQRWLNIFCMEGT